jgi:hypothetical protein
MLISCLPRRKIICGFSPPRAAIQRRTGDPMEHKGAEYSVVRLTMAVGDGK